MPRQLVEHVVEKPDPGAVVVLPRAIEVQLDLDGGLGGLSRKRRLAHVPGPRIFVAPHILRAYRRGQPVNSNP